MEQELNKIKEEIEKYRINNSSTIKTLKNDILQKMLFKGEELKNYHKLLKDYRYIDEIDELRYGSYIRWFNIDKMNKKNEINKSNKSSDKSNNNISFDLLRGGFIVDLKQVLDDIHILCKNGIKLFFTIKMSNCIIFQKNTKQEELLIQILDHVK
uniref:Uncharacterized protein n=1 Tax=viral metagenome TaxID=1070528 RepID=A0A6C0ETA3_9ZZZZ